MRLKAIAEIYNLHSFAQFGNLIFFVKNLPKILLNFAKSVKILKNFGNFGKILEIFEKNCDSLLHVLKTSEQILIVREGYRKKAEEEADGEYLIDISCRLSSLRCLCTIPLKRLFGFLQSIATKKSTPL